MWRRVLYVLVGLSMTACAATRSNGPSLTNARRDVITAAEIVTSHVTDVYQAVAHLRPEFLRRRTSRPTLTPVGVSVYLDDLYYGGSESLRHIPLERVRQIRYMNPTDADIRWGGWHPGGAILVTTLRK